MAGSGLVSQCSLHSCTSSEQGVPGGESSAASYTTSLSTDTLYWDDANAGGCGSASRSHSTKSKHSAHNVPKQSSHAAVAAAAASIACAPGFGQYVQAKPAKSWDNLTTKSFGGYGFGYGYLDTSALKTSNGDRGKNHTRTHSTKVLGSSFCFLFILLFIFY